MCNSPTSCIYAISFTYAILFLQIEAKKDQIKDAKKDMKSLKADLKATKAVKAKT